MKITKKTLLKYFFIIFIVFFLVIILNHHNVPPFDHLGKFKASLKNSYKSLEFKNNIKCAEKINNKSITKEETSDYSFFIAGHAYGTPSDNNLGIYEPFYLDLLNLKNTFNFGILAGDVVRDSTAESWDFFDKQIKNLDYEIYISPGNHDIGIKHNNIGLEYFKKKFGGTYFSFIRKQDLFIILDSNENHWNILNNQLNFFKKTLNDNYKNMKNIFIISHHLIYFDPYNKDFSKPVPNHLGGRSEKVNFWSTLYPLLENLNNKIFIIAGDTGLTFGKELFCHKMENFTFFATGMGSGLNDHYLIFESINGKIKIQVKKI